MTPERLAKIRALAADARGDPNIRAVAQALLDKYGVEEPWRPPPDPPSPGIGLSEEYERFIFMDLTQWGESANGNHVHTMGWKGRSYRFVLFRHKKTPTWGWLRIDIEADTESWSRNKYTTLTEAHQSAWRHLTLI